MGDAVPVNYFREFEVPINDSESWYRASVADSLKLSIERGIF
jgi:hypothetical protein